MLALALLLLLPAAHTRLLHSLPDDTYAFPKFRVAFLNGLPVLNDTAHRWLSDGLRGGELEFLDRPWKDHAWDAPLPLKEIGGTDTAATSPASDIPSTANYTLELMKLGPRDSYLCLIPKPPESTPSAHDEPSDADVTPARSWSLLQPLSGTCLYHRQGWFTYSYCHNDEIRQFKELAQAHPHIPGGYKPEEDPEWESYTLGRAPATPEPGADLTVAEQNALAANLELARSAGSRYLVQRWGDGTICDKTGKSREVEVQFHCSMAMSDTILFVKEAKTCSYVLVVQTPRLCGEPGFRSRRDIGEETQIRCREIVNDKSSRRTDLPDADHPLKMPRRKTVLPAPAPAAPKDAKTAEGGAKGKDNKAYNEFLQKALNAIMGNEKLNLQHGKVTTDETAEGNIIVEFVDELTEGETAQADADRLTEALRAAGFDVRTEKVKTKSEKEDRNTKKRPDDDVVDDRRRDEL